MKKELERFLNDARGNMRAMMKDAMWAYIQAARMYVWEKGKLSREEKWELLGEIEPLIEDLTLLRDAIILGKWERGESCEED